jgi:hypothetical protein
MIAFFQPIIITSFFFVRRIPSLSVGDSARSPMDLRLTKQTKAKYS